MGEYETALAAAERKLADLQQRLRTAEQQWAEVEKARDALAALRRQMADLDKRLAAGEKELAQIETELRAAQAKGDPQSLQQTLVETQHAASLLDEREKDKSDITEKRQAAAEESARRKGENDTLAPQTEPMKKRVETLSAATEPVCPTCGQPLTEDHRHSIIDELTAEVEARRSRYRDNQSRLKTLADELAAHDRQLAQINAELRERPALQKKLADLQSKVTVATEARAQIESLAARRARWRRTPWTNSALNRACPPKSWARPASASAHWSRCRSIAPTNWPRAKSSPASKVCLKNCARPSASAASRP
ncbi:MAG: hypothetical protein HZB20_03135 [Chloroflexi bacterium]|nr:hypothetical protein [Chloroflexota bacterium]